MKLNKRKGLSIVEVLVSILILGIVMSAAIVTQVNSFKVSRNSRDRIFAGQKAMQMMEELRSFAQGGGESTDDNLDKKRDGDSYPAVLTTEKIKGMSNSLIVDSDITSKIPSSPTSGNYIFSDGKKHWRFLRNIEVTHLSQDQKARKIDIKVYYSDENGKPILPALAQLSSIIRTTANPNEPSQVIDTYALTLDNVPGWWAALSSLRERYEAVVSDLRNRNVGLDFRSHYINRLSYGRDIFYAPYVNSIEATKDDSHLDYAYYYPGKIINTKNSSNSEYYYPYEKMFSDKSKLLTYTSSGHQIQNSTFEGQNDFDIESHTLADQFNNAVRYPEELAIHTRLRKENFNRTKVDDLEPTYRLFVEDMNSTSRYRNTIITNLHGELFPFPPLRNYSDAAKSPVDLPTVRVVTHPEKIKYDNTEKLRLRVYAYKRNDDSSADPGNKINNISIFIPTNGLTSSYPYLDSRFNDEIDKLKLPNFKFSDFTVSQIAEKINIIYFGPSDSSNSSKSYMKYQTDPISSNRTNSTNSNTINISPNEDNIVNISLPNVSNTINNGVQIIRDPIFDYAGAGKTYDAASVPVPVRGLLIILKAPTELSCPPTGSGSTVKGIPNGKKLYGMDYIPTPVDKDAGGKATFIDSTNELKDGNNKVKNTARWIIELDLSGSPATNPLANLQNKMVAFETRLPTNKTLSGDVITGKVDLTTGTRIDGTGNKYEGIPTQLGGSTDPSLRSAFMEQIPNLSRTYTWVGGAYNTTNSEKMPATEKFQIMGDPRYNPYLDVANSMQYNALFSKSENNTAFASSINPADYPSLAKIIGPNFDNDDDDIPRIFQLFRQGLLNSNAIYTSMTGYSNYYHGIGGEIGLDSNNPQDFTVSKKALNETGYGGITGAPVNELIGGIRYVEGKSQKWTSLPWIGELYPDSRFSDWSNKGNLPNSDFIRSKINDETFPGINGTGDKNISIKISSVERYKRMSTKGCASFFNGGSTDSDTNLFNHASTDNTGTLTTDMGSDLSLSLNLPSPNTIKVLRPFKLSNGNSTPERSDANFKSIYRNMRTELTFLPYEGKTAPYQDITNSSVFYNNDTSGLTSSAPVRLHDIGSKGINSNNNRAYVVVNGLAPEGQEGTIFLAKYAVSSMIYAFLNTGNIKNDDTSGNTTAEIPYVAIRSKDTKTSDNISVIGNSPKEGNEVTDPTMNIDWFTRWRKWDETRYTNKYDNKWIDKTPDLTLKYQLMYSKDGTNWKYISVSGNSGTSTNEIAYQGTYKDAYGIDGGSFDTTTGISKNSVTWNVSTLDSNQSYLFRIECYRMKKDEYGVFKPLLTHYSYHQREIYIKR